MLIYIYNIIIKDKKVLNNIKRRFYYTFNTKISKFSTKLSNNTLKIDVLHEKELDSFFNEFSGFIEVYKISVNSIERILEVPSL